ncbi:MAG: signal peptidase I [bacterium]
MLKRWKLYKQELREKNRLLYHVIDWAESIIVALILALIIRQFAFQTSEVLSGSMIPTLLVRDRVIVNKLVYKYYGKMERGDIVLFRSTIKPQRDFIKRLIALPGESIRIRGGQVLVNGKAIDQSRWPVIWDNSNFGPYRIPENSYFFLGDNRPDSFDSRYWGAVPRENIIGKAELMIWPPLRIRLFTTAK